MQQNKGLLHHWLCKQSELFVKKKKTKPSLTDSLLTSQWASFLTFLMSKMQKNFDAQPFRAQLYLKRLSCNLSLFPYPKLCFGNEDSQRSETRNLSWHTKTLQQRDLTDVILAFQNNWSLSSKVQGLSFTRLIWLLPISAMSHLILGFCSKEKSF